MIVARGSAATQVKYASYPAVSEVFAEAIRLIQQNGWSRHRDAVDDKDRMLFVKDRNAVRFSMTGAVRRAMPDPMATYETFHWLERAVGEPDVIGWNRYKARDARQVLAMLKKAQKLARAAEDMTRTTAAVKTAA